MNYTHNSSLNQNQVNIAAAINFHYRNIDNDTLQCLKDYRTGINAQKSLNTYGKYLTKEDIIELKNNIKTGLLAKKLLTLKYSYVIKQTVAKYAEDYSLPIDKLSSSAMKSFYRACRTYKYNSDINFVDFFKKIIQQNL